MPRSSRGTSGKSIRGWMLRSSRGTSGKSIRGWMLRSSYGTSGRITKTTVYPAIKHQTILRIDYVGSKHTNHQHQHGLLPSIALLHKQFFLYETCGSDNLIIQYKHTF